MSVTYYHMVQCASFSMAGIHLEPPAVFNFQALDKWMRWFVQFHSASGLTAEDEFHEVSTLLYCTGEEAGDVLISTNILEAEQQSYAEVMAKFDAHFQVQRNVIFKQVKFNCRNQLEGDIHQTIHYCALQPHQDVRVHLKDEIFHNGLVVGIQDA